MKPLQRRFDVVYLGLWPIAHKSEGLNVLLCDTIKPMAEDGILVTIHTTDRHVDKVAEALGGNGVDLKLVKIKVYQVGSLVLKFLYAFSSRRKHKAPRTSNLITLARRKAQELSSLTKELFYWLIDLTSYNWFYKLPVGMLILVFATTGVLAVSSISAMAAIAFGIALIILRKLLNVARRFARSKTSIMQIPVSSARKFYRQIYTDLVPQLFKREQERFATIVNRTDAIDRFFFFNSFDGHAVRSITKKKIVVFPDAVTFIFPLRFIGMHGIFQMHALRLSVTHADGIVCYSNFVRDAQLRRLFQSDVESKPIKVIPQGYFPLTATQETDKKLAQQELNKHRLLVKNFFPTLLKHAPSVDFEEFDYLLYPTIDRPHKNATTLIKAFELLLRRKHLNLKLVLTSPHMTGDVERLIIEKRLQYDVIFVPSVPIDVLNLLFKGASLMVHASLAEGGDIFNFSRAVSVGCPALLADVPVVREMFDRESIEPAAYEHWLFDPTDPFQLADKIQNVLETTHEFTSDQSEYLEKLSSYDFRSMAYSYLKFYEAV